MSLDPIALILPAFIAGILTFLAPCTLPLVPGYLGFISGVSLKEMQDPAMHMKLRNKVMRNALAYVLGFSLVFILLGTVFATAGVALAAYRLWLARIGGAFIIFFGLYLMHVFDLKMFAFLQREKRFNILRRLHPGKASSSFLFGVTFAFGWTPCVGPVLGSILILASSSGTALSGAFLLSIFSLGLAIPFLLLALMIGHASEYVRRLSKHLKIASFIGGMFLIFLGILLVTDNFVLWISFFYEWFDFLEADRLLDYL